MRHPPDKWPGGMAQALSAPDFLMKIFEKCRAAPIFTGNMDDSAYTISLAQFRRLFPVSSCLGMGDDVCLVNVRYDENLSVLRHPCRFDGFLAFFCVSGRMKVMINLTEFTVEENSMFVNIPGNVVSVSWVDETRKEDLQVIVIAMTGDYMSSLDVDIAKLSGKGIALMDRPFFFIKDDEKRIAERYVTLAADILGSNLMYKRESISALLSSIFFLAGGIVEQRIIDAGLKPVPETDRSREVFRQFLGLVAEYHTRERSVSFYAGKLCLTPKYLARLVKTATGKSASDWIGDYVTLEAKNMLRYSSLPVKEIVSRLNFPDASTFHKFFKARTGLTPVEYRKDGRRNT